MARLNTQLSLPTACRGLMLWDFLGRRGYPSAMTMTFHGKVVREINDWTMAVADLVPGAAGARLRAMLYHRLFGRAGSKPAFDVGLRLMGAENIEIGDRFRCGRNCTMSADGGGRIRIGHNANLNTNVFIGASMGGSIAIGNDALIGPNVVLRASNHRFDDPERPIRLQGHETHEIVIEDDVWLGANVVVMGEQRIGRGAIVAAGGLVTKDVAPMTVVGGVPARFLAPRRGPGPEPSE
jgi:galactoside O-acetyltransferase